jgi:hypothetical protein
VTAVVRHRVDAEVLAGEQRLHRLQLGHGPPERGTSPTVTAVPDNSTPRSSPYSCPSSTTTVMRGSRRRSAQRRLRVREYSHNDAPSHANHRAPTCGRPSGDTVATHIGRLTGSGSDGRIRHVPA